MIAESLQKELREKYNPEGSVLRQHQYRMIHLLKTVADICEKESIPYWLTHGTLLGAKRHGGFIPWDDDVDICIFRKDIREFRSLMQRQLPQDMVLQCHQTDSNYYHPYYKIRDLNSEMEETGNEDINYQNKGVYIDVFPVEKSHLLLVKITWKIWGRLLYRHILPKPLNPIRLLINRFLYFSFSTIFCICRFIDRIIPSDTWNFPYGCYFKVAPGYSDDDINPIDGSTKIQFEDRLYCCPNDVDSYLTKCYGNYNELPKEEEIEPHINEIKIW